MRLLRVIVEWTRKDRLRNKDVMVESKPVWQYRYNGIEKFTQFVHMTQE
jgi:hypothetical protein